MESIKFLMEKRMYGVCAYLGDKIGISSERIRLYFIYASCFTFGSPFLLYLFVAFWMNIKRYMQEKRSSVWDLE
ncbi:MAG: PspC domain-containing protein [Bacteroidetes bacterium]|nr:MAG: PspC domain-containing protein [Bacteroidota bacterium]